MGQSDSALLQAEEDPARDFRRRGGYSTENPHSPSRRRPEVGAEAKAHELFDLLLTLEQQLADPISVANVGQAYRQLHEWTKRHVWDKDLQEVLEWLKPDGIYPTWRRQALEEAYRLFYEDVAKEGEAEAIAVLPEPPTSEEIGFRRLPEALVSGAAVRAPLFSSFYEDKTACPIAGRRRWDYEIRRIEAKDRRANGREIVPQGVRETKPASATGSYVQAIAQVLVPTDQCCARRDEARRARGPFFLPEGPRAAPLRPPGQKPPRQRPLEHEKAEQSESKQTASYDYRDNYQGRSDRDGTPRGRSDREGSRTRGHDTLRSDYDNSGRMAAPRGPRQRGYLEEISMFPPPNHTAGPLP